MRVLSKRQKKYIDKIASERQLRTVSDLTGTEYHACQEMNDHETFWCNLERYITDKWWKERMNNEM
jgi:hypothetical protein